MEKTDESSPPQSNDGPVVSRLPSNHKMCRTLQEWGHGPEGFDPESRIEIIVVADHKHGEL